MQSFRFLNPKNPFLAQYSAPTLKHCAKSSNLELLSYTTTVLISTSIGLPQTNSRPAKAASEFTESARVIHSFQSRNPEPQDNRSWDREFWEPTQDQLKSCQNPNSPSFSELRTQPFISSRILETNFRNPDYTTPNRSRKRTAIKSYSAKNKPTTIDSKSLNFAKSLPCYQQP